MGMFNRRFPFLAGREKEISSARLISLYKISLENKERDFENSLYRSMAVNSIFKEPVCFDGLAGEFSGDVTCSSGILRLKFPFAREAHFVKKRKGDK